MLDASASSLNGRYETPIYAQDVALAMVRKVIGLQRQIVLELQTPSPDRKPSERVTEQGGKSTKEEREQNEPAVAQGAARADALNTISRLNVLV